MAKNQIHKWNICNFETANSLSYGNHFFSTHSVSVKSSFLCGLPNCNFRFYSSRSYEQHVLKTHIQYPISVPVRSDSENFENSGQFLCPHKPCTYVCSNPTTLRSHCFRKHKNISRSGPNLPTTADECESCVDDPEPFETIRNESSLFTVDDQQNDGGIGTETESDLEERLLKLLAHTYLTLGARYHVPESTLQFILERYLLFIEESQALLQKKLLNELAKSVSDCSALKPIINKAFANDLAVKFHGQKGPLRSKHIRKNLYAQFFKYVKPVELDLGPNESNEIARYQYVPIRDSLSAVMNDDSVYEQYVEKQQMMTSSGSTVFFRDISDGSVLRNHDLQGEDVIYIIAYQDDVEIANPLGSAKGKYKMNCWYYTWANLQPWSRSKIDGIQLIMLCKEVDTAYFGIPKIVRPLVEELKSLNEHGLQIRGKSMKVALLFLLGDNLAQHQIFVMNENFSTAEYFCRYCDESRTDWKRRWMQSASVPEDFHTVDDDLDSESSDESSDEEDAQQNCASSDDDSVLNSPKEPDYQEDAMNGHLVENCASSCLRSKESYADCVARLELGSASVKGIISDSCLNSIPFFHVTKGTPPCVDHDLFEGIVPFDLYLALSYFEKKYGLSKVSLNRKIRSFKFLSRDSLDKPARIPIAGSKLKGHAAQNAVFLRFVLLFVEGKVDHTDQVYQMVILLSNVAKCVCSSYVPSESLPRLRNLIHQYMKLRSSCFKDVPFRPKHHFVEHYPELIKLYGPLKRVSTLPFEQRHKFFKETIRASRNFKNTPKSLAESYQLYQSSLTVTHRFSNVPTLEKDHQIDVLDVNDEVNRAIKETFGDNIAQKSLQYASKLTFQNTTYAAGECVVVSYGSGGSFRLEICRISVLLLLDRTPYVVGRKCKGELCARSNVHYLCGEEGIMISPLKNLLDYVSYPIYQRNRKQFIVVHHLSC